MTSTESVPRSSEDPDVQRLEDDENSGSRIWTKVEEAILIDSIEGYKAAPYKKKAEYVKDRVVKRIKNIDIKKHGAAAYEKGGEMYDAWKLKKKVDISPAYLHLSTLTPPPANIQLYDALRRNKAWGTLARAE